MDLKFYNIVVEILIEHYEVIFLSEPHIPDDKTPHTNLNNGQIILSTNGSSPPQQQQPPQKTAKSFDNDFIYTNHHPTANSTYANHISPPIRHNQPYTLVSGNEIANQANNCFNFSIFQTVKTYIEPHMSSSMYSVHEPTNPTLYALSRSEHISTGKKIKKLPFKPAMVSTVCSQSESNIPNLQNFSPTRMINNRFGNQNDSQWRIVLFYDFFVSEPNSTSSSNESVSSTSRDSSTPKKNEHSTHLYASGLPRLYKSPGNV